MILVLKVIYFIKISKNNISNIYCNDALYISCLKFEAVSLKRVVFEETFVMTVPQSVMNNWHPLFNGCKIKSIFLISTFLEFSYEMIHYRGCFSGFAKLNSQITENLLLLFMYNIYDWKQNLSSTMWCTDEAYVWHDKETLLMNGFE